MSGQEIIGKYSGDINLLRIIEDYIKLLQIRIKKNEIKAASGQMTIPSIKLFCEMNDEGHHAIQSFTRKYSLDRMQLYNIRNNIALWIL